MEMSAILMKICVMTGRSLDYQLTDLRCRQACMMQYVKISIEFELNCKKDHYRTVTIDDSP